LDISYDKLISTAYDTTEKCLTEKAKYITVKLAKIEKVLKEKIFHTKFL
jgi:hypothetical protein